jgi:hypothetical protein
MQPHATPSQGSSPHCCGDPPPDTSSRQARVPHEVCRFGRSNGAGSDPDASTFARGSLGLSRRRVDIAGERAFAEAACLPGLVARASRLSSTRLGPHGGHSWQRGRARVAALAPRPSPRLTVLLTDRKAARTLREGDAIRCPYETHVRVKLTPMTGIYSPTAVALAPAICAAGREVNLPASGPETNRGPAGPLSVREPFAGAKPTPGLEPGTPSLRGKSEDGNDG